jgi:glycosyltransferase involved in cell wall biosynthesis
MKISVLIPTYNRKTMVTEALRKIFSFQPRSYHEVIVSDNHSTDGTGKALFQEFGRQILFTQPKEHIPAYKNWQHAYLQATGSHVHFHWSDDWLVDNLYAQTIERHEKTGANIFVTSARVVFEDGFNPVYYSQGSDRNLSARKALRRLLLSEGRDLPRSPMAYIIPIESLREAWFQSIPAKDGHDPIQLAIGPDALLVASALLQEKGRLDILPGPDVAFRNHADCISVKNSDLLDLYGHCYLFFARRYRLRDIEEALDSAVGKSAIQGKSWFRRLRSLIFRQRLSRAKKSNKRQGITENKGDCKQL